MKARFLPAPPELDRAAFRGWLEQTIKEHGPTAPVGLAASSCRCPVALFLRAAGRRFWVKPDRLEAYGRTAAEDETRRLPDWAARFIRATDERFRAWDGVWFEVPAGVALEILDGLPE